METSFFVLEIILKHRKRGRRVVVLYLLFREKVVGENF